MEQLFWGWLLGVGKGCSFVPSHPDLYIFKMEELAKNKLKH